MSLAQISVEQALATRFDAVIDARSPAEFAEDHLTGAVNWPTLDDEQRRVVGTLYKQVDALAARKLGAAMAGRNLAAHVEAFVHDKPRDWRPLVYCWRGGQRSGSLAWFLSQIGFRTCQLSGGYKAWRANVRTDLLTLPRQFSFHVLCGRTGSGKTRLLQALRLEGAQVLDLEALACHRGSVLGGVPGQPQPSQKRFDTLLWEALRGFDAQRPVFVESESRKVGALRVPEALIEHMRAHGLCLRIEMGDAARLDLLMAEYDFFAQQVDVFNQALEGLVEPRGREQVARWRAQAQAGQWRELFGDLMTQHYDPLYQRSLARSFAQLESAQVVELADGGEAALHAAARQLVAVA